MSGLTSDEGETSRAESGQGRPVHDKGPETSDRSVTQTWERPVAQRIALIVTGTAVTVFGAYTTAARRSASWTRPLTAAIVLGTLALIAGVLYAVGVPVVQPASAPTSRKAKVARVVRWPLGAAFIGSIIWIGTVPDL